MTNDVRLGAGDSAYILAWCAWREAVSQSEVDWTEQEEGLRFVTWWDETGNSQLERYGHHLLDTGSTDPVHEAARAILDHADREGVDAPQINKGLLDRLRNALGNR